MVKSIKNEPIQVERTIKEKRKKYRYADIKYGEDGWVDVKEYLPANYDLCFLKTEKRIILGWYSMSCWEGNKINQDDKILFWKRKIDEEKNTYH